MEEAARKRRERLEKLKASQSLIVNDHPVSATPVGNAAVSEDDNSNKHKQSVVDSAPLVGTNKKRSRDEDGDLKNAEADAAAQLEAAKQQQKAETIERIAETLNKEVKEQLEELSQAEVDLLNLAPKKIDWDLKRDLEPKLERLQRQTQRKIEHLIRIRLSQQASTLADKESAFSKLAGHLHQNELENVNDDYSDASD